MDHLPFTVILDDYNCSLNTLEDYKLFVNHLCFLHLSQGFHYYYNLISSTNSSFNLKYTELLSLLPTAPSSTELDLNQYSQDVEQSSDSIAIFLSPPKYLRFPPEMIIICIGFDLNISGYTIPDTCLLLSLLPLLSKQSPYKLTLPI
ncbi:hypothetical protein QTN25_008172 [Entamoeba marina]